jgi:peptide/nickel transport system substrate-binding protein
MFHKKNLRLLIFSVVIGSLFLSACSTTQATQTTAPVEATQAPQVQPTEAPSEAPTQAAKKVATFIWTQEFDSLNPYYTNMWFSQVTQQLWSCWAWNYDENGSPLPNLVKEMPTTENGGISADGKTITLKLRDDLKWSDNEKLTSKDFLFTYNMVMNDANTVNTRNPYDKMVSVSAPDDLTVIVLFKDVFVPWLAMFQGILPEHVLQPVFDAAGNINSADWNRAPTVGCGPYNFDSWESGTGARFVVNPNYWLETPKIDEVYFKFVPDDATQVADLRNKDGDLGTFIVPEDYAALEGVGYKVILVPSNYNEGFYFQFSENAHPAIKDLNVRLAIAYGTNRPKLVNDLLLGKNGVASTYWDLTPWVDPSLKPYPYDPEKAKQLLDEAGWVDSNGNGTRDKDGVELVLKYGTTIREIRQDTQAVIQQDLKNIGIGTDLSSFEKDVFFNDLSLNGPCTNGDLDICEYSTSPFSPPDPDSPEYLCSEIPTDEKPSGLNWYHICDEELDRLMQLQATQVDFPSRQKTFQELTKLVYDKVYWLGLWQDPDSWAIGSRLNGVKISGTTPFFNIIEWDLAEPTQ